MNPLELALARSKAYALFEMLYLKGITPSTKDSIQQIPELNSSIDFGRGYDEFAADHYSMFVHNLPPYASIFLEDEGQPGGEVTESAMRAFRGCGYKPSTTSEAADHIGHIMGCLSFICGAESDAWEDGRHEIAGQMRQIQVELLEEQVLPWIFPLWWAIRSIDTGVYRELANLTVNITTDHYAGLDKMHSEIKTPFNEDEPFDTQGSKLQDIASFLLKPAKSGIWLSAKAIGNLSREFDLPRGFGDRKTTMLNLLKSAGKYGTFDRLMRNLSTQLSEAHVQFEGVKMEDPHLGPFLTPWSQKIGQTSSTLHDLELAWKQSQTVEV